MLYLIRSFTRGGKSIVKIGYTGDLRGRMENYYHGNPGFEFLTSREGTMEDELRLQLYLRKYKAPILDEWFIDCPEVQEGFHQAQEKIRKNLWKHRDEIWTRIDDFKDTRMRSIYEDLRAKIISLPYIGAEKIYKNLVAKETYKKTKTTLDDDFPWGSELKDFW